MCKTVTGKHLIHKRISEGTLVYCRPGAAEGGNTAGDRQPGMAHLIPTHLFGCQNSSPIVEVGRGDLALAGVIQQQLPASVVGSSCY